jgi:hypothetical protein
MGGLGAMAYAAHNPCDLASRLGGGPTTEVLTA